MELSYYDRTMKPGRFGEKRVSRRAMNDQPGIRENIASERVPRLARRIGRTRHKQFHRRG